MARINNAKNFKGKSYVASDEITNIINSIQFSNNIISIAGSKVQDETQVGKLVNSIDLSNLTGFLKTTDRVTEIKDTIDAESLNVPTDYAVRQAIKDAVDDAVDEVTSQAIGIKGGDGILVTTDEGDSTTKIISTDIKLEKLAKTTTGYASSYQLMVKSADGYKAAGDIINITKDQFLKGAEIVEGAMINDKFTLKTDIEELPENVKIEKFIHFTFEINTTNETGSIKTEENHVYLNVHELVDVYKAGDGIAIDDKNNITAIADSSDKIYASKGVPTSIIEVTSNGIKVSGVQSAIDLAVNDAYAKTSSAITAVNANVEKFESAVNANVSSTVTQVNTKINSAVSSVNTQVNSAITAVNGKVDSAVTAVNGAITSTVSSVNAQVKALASQVVTIVDEPITTSNTSGVVTATVSAARIIAVYDDKGAQIYPEISRDISENSIVYTLTADYGSAISSAPAWSVLCAKHTGVTYTDATIASATAPNAVTYSSATIASATAPAKVEYANAESATEASYTSANYDNTVTVEALDYKSQAQS